MSRARLLYVLIFAWMILFSAALAAPVHTTYLWHLEQPIYWPAPTTYGAGYETAMESIWRRNAGAAHPENDVAGIFTVADRIAAYQDRPKNSIATMSGVDAGAQVTYSGGLIRNVASLAATSFGGYTGAWNSHFQTARNWTTTGGNPRLEMTVISYHHSFAPLIDSEVLKKDIQIYQYVYATVWGASPPQSKGFFPPEIAFSQRIIPVLRDCGLDWTFIASTHLSRACSNFPLTLGTGGENCNPPNRADQLNPPQTNWRTQTISRGCSPTDAVPFAFQPHRAIHVDAYTGLADTIVVIPVAMSMSWQDGYQMYNPDDIDLIAGWNDPTQPMLVTLGHDGDNAFGGGYSYYMQSVSQFTSQAVARGYEPTTVPEYLADHAPALSDIVHVEDGAWINADGDFGDPDFPNWMWPPHSATGQIDIDNGWAIDAHNWAVITAATNVVLTAEDVAGPSYIPAIQNPRTNPPTSLDLAWHFLLGSLNSGYMYYGTTLDMEMKPVIACNAALDHAEQVIGGASDVTPPTIWTLQQWPHNPGELGFGPLHGYQQVQNPRDFRVWTFVADYSGVEACSLYYRLDNDGANPLASFENETYAGGAEVTSWRTRAMTRRNFPAGNPYNYGDVVFDELPSRIAQQYTYHLTDGEVTDSGGVLLDYFVQAWDSAGNSKRSDIYHTYVGTGQGSTGDDRVWWQPQTPEGGSSVTIYYDAALGTLPPNSNPVYIHIGHSGWQGILTPDPQMIFDTEAGAWRYTYNIPAGATSVDFVFRDNSGNWDNNFGQDWHITVIPSGSPGFVMDGVRDAGSVEIGTDGAMHLWADYDGSNLYLATESAQGTGYDRFLFVAQSPSALQAAPWAKSGQVAAWSAYIGNEESNGWRGWFDAQGSVALASSGTIVEGTLNLAEEFSGAPDSVFVCLARYQSPNGGTLQGQIPSAIISNGSIEGSEYQVLHLKPRNLTLATDGSTVTLRWQGSDLAQAYRVWRVASFAAEPLLLGTTDGLSFTDSVAVSHAVYWVDIQF